MLGLADLASRRPWALLGVNAAVAAAAILAALGAPGDLGPGSTRLDGHGPETLVVVLQAEGPGGPGVLAVASDVVASQLEADPAVGNVTVSEDGEGGRSVLLAELEAVSAAAREDAVERISRGIDPGPLQAVVGGETAALIEATHEVGADLWRLELLVLPLILLLAAVSAGPRVLLAPVLSTVTALAGSVALLRLAGVGFDVSLLGAAPVLAVGVVLGIELPALVTRLYREEAAIAPAGPAMRQTVARAGPLLAGAALAGSVPAFALLATPLDQAASLALGCAFAAALAAASALVATPATIAVLGVGSSAEPERPGWAERLAGAIRSLPSRAADKRLRCAVIVVAAAGAGLALAYPALDGTTRPFHPADLPAGSEIARASAGVTPQATGADSLFPELAIAAGVAAALLAALFLVSSRAPGALVAVPFALLPAAVGVGACTYVLAEGHLATLLDTEGRGVLDTASVAAASSALVSIAAARTWIALRVARAERRLGIPPDGAAHLTARLTLPGAAGAALAGAAAGAVLIGSDLAVARELGLAIAAGLVADLALVRIPVLAALARWGGGEGTTDPLPPRQGRSR